MVLGLSLLRYEWVQTRFFYFTEVKIIFKELRINEEIRAREVRLVSENSEEQFGVLDVRKAMDIAHARDLDLVEIAPNAKPPVCKMMNYGKYRFDQLKREKEAKKKQKVITLKEVKLRLNIEEHDFETKARNAEKFLKSGNKVKVTIMFRGREITHPDLGMALCRKMAERLAEVSQIEKAAKVEGRNMTMILAPKN